MNQWPASGKYMVELLVHHGLSLMLRGMDRKTAKGHAHQTELFSIGNVEWDAAVVHGFEMRRSVWPLPLCTWFR